MREKEKIDYIHFDYQESRKNGVFFQREELAGIVILKVIIRIKKGKQKPEQECINSEKSLQKEICLSDRMLKKIKKEIKRYQTEGCVLGADEEIADQLELADALFEARKLEMLQQRSFIFKQLRQENKEGRNRMLLVMESRKWNPAEILSLLLTAKDYYEDIYVVYEQDYFGIDRIAEYMYEEFGVVIHVQNKDSTDKIQEYDFVLFLLEKWEGRFVRKYAFRRAYVVMEEERGMIRKEEKKLKDNGGALYSGLAYKKQHKPLPYQMAVNIACQNKALYAEFAVSFVAICRLEWYNKE